MTYTTIYYQGGAEVGEWHKTLAVLDLSAAEARAAEIERQGRPALIHRTAQLDALGLPEGPPAWWDFGTLKRIAGKPGHYAKKPRSPSR